MRASFLLLLLTAAGVSARPGVCLPHIYRIEGKGAFRSAHADPVEREHDIQLQSEPVVQGECGCVLKVTFSVPGVRWLSAHPIYVVQGGTETEIHCHEKDPLCEEKHHWYTTHEGLGKEHDGGTRRRVRVLSEKDGLVHHVHATERIEHVDVPGEHVHEAEATMKLVSVDESPPPEGRCEIPQGFHKVTAERLRGSPDIPAFEAAVRGGRWANIIGNLTRFPELIDRYVHLEVNPVRRVRLLSAATGCAECRRYVMQCISIKCGVSSLADFLVSIHFPDRAMAVALVALWRAEGDKSSAPALGEVLSYLSEEDKDPLVRGMSDVATPSVEWAHFYGNAGSEGSWEVLHGWGKEKGKHFEDDVLLALRKEKQAHRNLTEVILAHPRTRRAREAMHALSLHHNFHRTQLDCSLLDHVEDDRVVQEVAERHRCARAMRPENLGVDISWNIGKNFFKQYTLGGNAARAQVGASAGYRGGLSFTPLSFAGLWYVSAHARGWAHAQVLGMQYTILSIDAEFSRSGNIAWDGRRSKKDKSGGKSPPLRGKIIRVGDGFAKRTAYGEKLDLQCNTGIDLKSKNGSKEVLAVKDGKVVDNKFLKTSRTYAAFVLHGSYCAVYSGLRSPAKKQGVFAGYEIGVLAGDVLHFEVWKKERCTSNKMSTSGRRALTGILAQLLLPAQCSGHIPVFDNGTRITHKEAIDLLGWRVRVDSVGYGSPDRCTPGKVSLTDVRWQTVMMAKDLRRASGCPRITVTGGTELYDLLPNRTRCEATSLVGTGRTPENGWGLNFAHGEWDCLSLFLRKSDAGTALASVLSGRKECVYHVQMYSYEVCLLQSGEWELTALPPKTPCSMACLEPGLGCRSTCNVACCGYDHGRCVEPGDAPEAAVEEWPGTGDNTNCLIDPVMRLWKPKGLLDVNTMLNHVNIGVDADGEDANILRVVVLTNVRMHKSLLEEQASSHHMHPLFLRLETSGSLAQEEKPLFRPYELSYGVLFFKASLRVGAYALYGVDWMAALDIGKRELQAGISPNAGIMADIDGFVDIFFVRGGVTLRGEVTGYVPFVGTLLLDQWPPKLCIEANVELSGGISFLAFYQIRDKFECRWVKVWIFRFPVCFFFYGARRERTIFEFTYTKTIPLFNFCLLGRASVPLKMSRVRLGEWNNIRYISDTMLPVYWDPVRQGDCPESPTYQYRLSYPGASSEWSLESKLTEASVDIPTLPEGTKVTVEVQVKNCEGALAKADSHEAVYSSLPPAVTVYRGFLRGKDHPFTSTAGFLCVWTDIKTIGPIRWYKMKAIRQEDGKVVGEGEIGSRGCTSVNAEHGKWYSMEVEAMGANGMIGTGKSKTVLVDTSTPSLLESNVTCRPDLSKSLQASTGKWCVEVHLGANPSGIDTLQIGLGEYPRALNLLKLRPLPLIRKGWYGGVFDEALPVDKPLYPMVVGTTGGGLTFTHSLPHFIETSTPPSPGGVVAVGGECQREERDFCVSHHGAGGKYGGVTSEWRVRTDTAVDEWGAINGTACRPVPAGAKKLQAEVRVTDEVELQSSTKTVWVVVDRSEPTCGTAMLSDCGGVRLTKDLWGSNKMLCVTLNNFRDQGCGMSHVRLILEGPSGAVEEWNLTKVNGESVVYPSEPFVDASKYQVRITGVDKAGRSCVSPDLHFTVLGGPPVFPTLRLQTAEPAVTSNEVGVEVEAQDELGMLELKVGVCVSGMMVASHSVRNPGKAWSGNLTITVPAQDGDILQPCAHAVNLIGYFGKEYSDDTTVYDTSAPSAGDVMVVAREGSGSHLSHIKGDTLGVAIDRTVGMGSVWGERDFLGNEGRYALFPEMYTVSSGAAWSRCGPGRQAILVSEGTEATDTLVATACHPTGPVVRRFSNSDEKGSVKTSFGGSWVTGSGDAVSPLYSTAPLDEFCILEEGRGTVCTVQSCLGGKSFASVTPRSCFVVREGDSPPYLTASSQGISIQVSSEQIGEGLGNPLGLTDIETAGCRLAESCKTAFNRDVVITGRQPKLEGVKKGFNDPHSSMECFAKVNDGEWVPYPERVNFLNFTFSPPLTGYVVVKAKCCNLAGLCTESTAPMAMVGEAPGIDVTSLTGVFASSQTIGVEWEVHGTFIPSRAEYCIRSPYTPKCKSYVAVPLTGIHQVHDERLLSGEVLVQCIRVWDEHGSSLVGCASQVVVDLTPPTTALSVDCGCGTGCKYAIQANCTVKVGADDPESETTAVLYSGDGNTSSEVFRAPGGREYTVTIPAAPEFRLEAVNGAGLEGAKKVTVTLVDSPPRDGKMEERGRLMCYVPNQVGVCITVGGFSDEVGMCEMKLVLHPAGKSPVVLARANGDHARLCVDRMVVEDIMGEVGEGEVEGVGRSCSTLEGSAGRARLVRLTEPPKVWIATPEYIVGEQFCPKVTTEGLGVAVHRLCLDSRCVNSSCIPTNGETGLKTAGLYVKDCAGQLAFTSTKVHLDREPPKAGTISLCDGVATADCLEWKGFTDDSQGEIKYRHCLAAAGKACEEWIDVGGATVATLSRPAADGDTIKVEARDGVGRTVVVEKVVSGAGMLDPPTGLSVPKILYLGEGVCIKWDGDGEFRLTVLQGEEVLHTEKYGYNKLCLNLKDMKEGQVLFQLVRTAQGASSPPAIAMSTAKEAFVLHGVAVTPLLAVAPLNQLTLSVNVSGDDAVQVDASVGEDTFSDEILPSFPFTMPLTQGLAEGVHTVEVKVSRGTRRHTGQVNLTVVAKEGPKLALTLPGAAGRRGHTLESSAPVMTTTKILEFQVGMVDGVSATWCIGLGEGGCDIGGPWPLGSDGLVSTKSVAHLIADGVLHYVSVIACNSAGACNTQSSQVIGDSSPPDAPTIEMPEWNNGTVNVTWDGADDPHTGVQGYEICHGPSTTDCVAAYRTAAQEGWDVVSGLSNGAIVHVCVRAINGAGGQSLPSCGMTNVAKTGPNLDRAIVAFNGTEHKSKWGLVGTLAMQWSWDTVAPMEWQAVGVRRESEEYASGWVDLSGEARMYIYEGYFANLTRWSMCVRGRTEAGAEAEGCTPITEIFVGANASHYNYTDPSAPLMTKPLTLSPCIESPDCVLSNDTVVASVDCVDPESDVLVVTLCVDGVNQLCTDLPNGSRSLSMDASLLREGKVRATASCTNYAGNTSTSEAIIIVDRSPPEVAHFAPPRYYSAGYQHCIPVSIVDVHSGMKRVWMDVMDNTHLLRVVETEVQDGKACFTLPHGSYTAIASGTNWRGMNVSTSAALVVDSTPPFILGDTSLQVEGGGRCVVGMTSVTLCHPTYVDPESGIKTVCYGSAELGFQDCSPEKCFTFNRFKLPPVGQTITVSYNALNNAGMRSTTGVFTCTVEGEATPTPAPLLLSPPVVQCEQDHSRSVGSRCTIRFHSDIKASVQTSYGVAFADSGELVPPVPMAPLTALGAFTVVLGSEGVGLLLNFHGNVLPSSTSVSLSANTPDDHTYATVEVPHNLTTLAGILSGVAHSAGRQASDVQLLGARYVQGRLHIDVTFKTNPVPAINSLLSVWSGVMANGPPPAAVGNDTDTVTPSPTTASEETATPTPTRLSVTPSPTATPAPRTTTLAPITPQPSVRSQATSSSSSPTWPFAFIGVGFAVVLVVGVVVGYTVRSRQKLVTELGSESSPRKKSIPTPPPEACTPAGEESEDDVSVKPDWEVEECTLTPPQQTIPGACSPSSAPIPSIRLG